jgi:excinuclease UvrABC helicase subunit UvrB
MTVSEAMRNAIALTYYRRKLQNEYNKKNNITPTTILSSIKNIGVKSRKQDY